MATTMQDMGENWRTAWEDASRRYIAALERVDPNHQHDTLGVSIRHDAIEAADPEIRAAAADMVRLMNQQAALA